MSSENLLNEALNIKISTMKTIAIHQHDDWYSVQITGLGSIGKSEIEVELKITDKEVSQLDYKTLRGMAILERFEEKEERQIVEEPMLNYSAISLLPNDTIFTTDELIEKIKTLPKNR
jgi:hypothetical protein